MTAPSMEERPPCVVCRHRRSAEGSRTCGGCSEELRDALDEIVERYAVQVLDPEALLPVASQVGRTSPGYRSVPPTSLGLLTATDRRLSLEGERQDVLGVLAGWADHVRESVGLRARPRPRCVTAWRFAQPTVPSEVKVLVRMWPWIRAQEAVAELGRNIMLIRDTLRELAGEQRGKVRIGRCVKLTEDVDVATGQAARCGQLLLARLGDRSIRCPRCTTKWPARLWPDLAEQMERTG